MYVPQIWIGQPKQFSLSERALSKDTLLSGAELKSETSFQQIFEMAISESVDSVLGYNVSQFVSGKLKSFSGEKNLDELHQRLLSIFGESGSMLIELRIVNLLHSKLGGCFEIDHHIGSKFLERNCRLARNAYQDCIRNSS